MVPYALHTYPGNMPVPRWSIFINIGLARGLVLWWLWHQLFCKFWCCIAMNKNDMNLRLLSHTSHEQPTVLPYHPCCCSNRYGGWICSGLIDGGFMIHRMWMLVHHRHRVVPRHQRRRPSIVHIDVSPQPIPSDTIGSWCWHQYITSRAPQWYTTPIIWNESKGVFSIQNINHSTTYDIEQLIVLATLQEEICY